MKNNRLPGWLIAVCILLIAYLMIIGRLLYPYLQLFLDNKFIIEPNDLPNYQDVFNSIFLVVQIIITSLLTYQIYRTAENQRKQNYEVNNTKVASYLFYELKFSLVSITTRLLINNIEFIIDEEIRTQNQDNKETTKKSGLSLIKSLDKFDEFSTINLDKMKESLVEVTHLLGKDFNERDIMYYHLLIIDLENASSALPNNFSHLFNQNFNKLVKGEKVGSGRLYTQFYDFLYNNKFALMDERYSKLFKKLYYLKKNGS